MVDIHDTTEATAVAVPAFVSLYDHKHGTDVDVFYSKEAAITGFANIALDWWDDRQDKTAPQDPRSAGWTDQQIVDAYFEGNETEFYSIEERMLFVPLSVLEEVVAKAHNEEEIL